MIRAETGGVDRPVEQGPLHEAPPPGATNDTGPTRQIHGSDPEDHLELPAASKPPPKSLVELTKQVDAVDGGKWYEFGKTKNIFISHESKTALLKDVNEALTSAPEDKKLLELRDRMSKALSPPERLASLKKQVDAVDGGKKEWFRFSKKQDMNLKRKFEIFYEVNNELNNGSQNSELTALKTRMEEVLSKEVDAADAGNMNLASKIDIFHNVNKGLKKSPEDRKLIALKTRMEKVLERETDKLVSGVQSSASLDLLHVVRLREISNDPRLIGRQEQLKVQLKVAESALDRARISDEFTVQDLTRSTGWKDAPKVRGTKRKLSLEELPKLHRDQNGNWLVPDEKNGRVAVARFVPFERPSDETIRAYSEYIATLIPRSIQGANALLAEIQKQQALMVGLNEAGDEAIRKSLKAKFKSVRKLLEKELDKQKPVKK